MKRLERYDFDGGCLFTDANRGMLFEDTVGKRRRDGEIVESWYRAGQWHALDPGLGQHALARCS
jgi:hypothetical protein